MCVGRKKKIKMKYNTQQNFKIFSARILTLKKFNVDSFRTYCSETQKVTFTRHINNYPLTTNAHNARNVSSRNNKAKTKKK